MLAIIKNTNHRIKYTKIFNEKVEKYWLPVVRIQNPAGLRRWNYLTHPPSPLSGSRGQKMRAQREGAEFYISGGSLPPPCRAADPLPPTGGAAGGLPPGRGAAGSLLKYKTPTLPSAPSFSAHKIQRGERERGGVREVKKPAKPCKIFDPNRR